MQVAPQSTGSATSLTGGTDFEERVDLSPRQGGLVSGEVFLGVGGFLSPRACLCSHLEHLEAVAEPAGREIHIKCSNCQLTTYSTTVTSSQFRFLNQGHEFFFMSISSRMCDSRNLNLSPLCNTTAPSLARWQPAINSTYGNITTNYTKNLSPGPWRLKYPKNSWAEKELLVSLTQVFILNASFHHE